MYLRLESALFKWVSRPLSARLALVLALLIMAPTLFAGFFVDDYLHLLTLRGEDTVATPFDLFQFAPGNAEALSPYINKGPFPWYTLPDIKLHFFRPLSSATMVLDHALFGESGFFYHVHSMLWYAALILGVCLLFRRSMAPGLAGICCLLYLVDDGHIIPAIWWSNRNAMVAAAPAILGLVAHLKWRQDGWRPGLPLSLTGFGLGLLGGETALGIFGYLIAYEAIHRQDTWLVRVRALTPAGLLAVCYLAIYKLSNFGVYGSGVYLDPIAEWPAYLRALPVRFADLIGAQFFSLPSELPVISNALRPHLLVASVFATLIVAAGVILLWRMATKEERSLLVWMGLGSFIASLPVLATFPSGRLLLLPSIGGAVWIGLFIQKAFGLAADAKWHPVRPLGRFFLLLHVALMPAYWIAACTAIPTVIGLSEAAFHEVDMDVEDPAGQQVICLYAPDPYTGFYPLVMRQYLGYPAPKSWQCLSMAPFAQEMTRTESDRIEVRILNGELLSTPFERLVRSERFPFAVGDTVALEGFTIEILEVGDWGPRHFAVQFDQPLEDPRYHFLAWQEGRLAPYEWPPIGEARTLSAAGGFFAWPHFKKRIPLL
jgi:hypothetical protein